MTNHPASTPAVFCWLDSKNFHILDVLLSHRGEYSQVEGTLTGKTRADGRSRRSTMIEHEAFFSMGGFHMLLRIDDSRARHSRVPFKLR